MTRWLFLPCLFVVGCGTTPDERPVTFEVVTLEVLAPTCGQVQCHSTTTWTKNFAVDTIDAARDSFNVKMTISGPEILDAIDGNGLERMPPDLPLARQDRALIQAWVDAGEPGL